MDVLKINDDDDDDDDDEPNWDYYTNSVLIWVVGIKQIIDTIFDTTSRHDVTM